MTTKLTVWLAISWCLLLASQKSLRFRMFIIENSVGDISVEWYWSLQRSMLQPAALLYQFCECFCRLLSGDWLWPCPMLAAATVDDAFFRLSMLLRCYSIARNDGWKCKLIIRPLILLTMWYDNNILKPAHDRALSFFRKSIWLRRLGMEWNGKHRWWITSDWHTKIITHIIFFSASYPFIRWFSCRFRVSPNNILFTLSSSPFNVLYMKITLFLSFLCVRWVLGVCRLMLNTFHVVEIGRDGHTACFPESHRLAPIIVRRLHAQWLMPLNKYRHPCLVTPN